VSNNTFQIPDYINLVIAFATFFTGLVALFGEKFWRWLARPKIGVSFDDKNSEYYQLISQDNGNFSIPTYYIRLKVSNNGGRTLRNTEVVLERIEPMLNAFQSLNLGWSNQVPDIMGISRTIRISEDQSRPVDIIEVNNPSSAINASTKTTLVLEKKRYEAYSKGFRCCSIKPNTLSDILPAGRYIFHIKVYADEVKPLPVKLSIKYDGTWTNNREEMRTKHLKVKLL